jgi:hypothetical protein
MFCAQCGSNVAGGSVACLTGLKVGWSFGALIALRNGRAPAGLALRNGRAPAGPGAP